MGIEISNSRAKTFLACHQQYHYKYERKLRARVSGRPLYFGSWMHSLIETYYSGGDWRKTHKKLTKEYDGYFQMEKEMLGDLPTECKHKMEEYVWWWERQDEGVNDMEVLAVELDLKVPMLHGHTMTLKIDRITRDEVGLWIWETKNHKTFPDSMYRFTDIQSARYAWAVEHGTDFGKPVGIVWDYLISKPATIPHLNKPTKAEKRKYGDDYPGSLSKAKINTTIHTFVRFCRDHDLNPRDFPDVIMKLQSESAFFRRDRVPVTPQISKTLVRDLIYTADEIERGKWKPVRNIGKHCAWCDFQKICVTELYGGDAKAVLEGSYVVKGGEDGDEDEELEVLEEI